MIHVFANRNKNEKWWACMVNGLKMIEEQISDRILTGQVGSISPVIPSLRGAKTPTQLTLDLVEAPLQKVASTRKYDRSNKDDDLDMASKKHKC